MSKVMNHGPIAEGVGAWAAPPVVERGQGAIVFATLDEHLGRWA